MPFSFFTRKEEKPEEKDGWVEIQTEAPVAAPPPTTLPYEIKPVVAGPSSLTSPRREMTFSKHTLDYHLKDVPVQLTGGALPLVTFNGEQIQPIQSSNIDWNHFIYDFDIEKRVLGVLASL